MDLTVLEGKKHFLKLMFQMSTRQRQIRILRGKTSQNMQRKALQLGAKQFSPTPPKLH